MAISLGDAVLTLGADANPIKKAIQAANADVKSGLGNAANAGKLLFAGMAAAITASIATIGVAAFKSAGDFDAASKKMTSALGLPIEESKRLKEIINGIYTEGNFGDSIQQVAEIATRVIQSLKDVGVTSNEEIRKISEGVIALGDTFGTDYAKSIDAVKALMGEFGLTSQQALDLVSAGMQRGLNASDDFLDTITEYSNQFSVGGASAEQFFSVMETGLANGVLGTDKAADMFKEFQVRILDGSKSTSEALEQIGIDSDTFTNAISSGQMTVAEAFTNVTKTLGGVSDQSIVMQAGVGLLGTQFEDLGSKVALGVDMAKTKLSELGGSTDKLNSQYNTLGNYIQHIWRNIKDAFAPAMDVLNEAIANKMPRILELIKQFANEFGPSMAAKMSELMQYAMDNIDKLQNKLVEYGPQIKEKLSEIFNAIIENAPMIKEKMGEIFNFLTDTIIPVVQKIIEFVAKHPELTAMITAFALLAPSIAPFVTAMVTLGGAFGAVSLAATATTLGVGLLVIAAVAGAVKIGEFVKALYDWQVAEKQLHESNIAVDTQLKKYIETLKAKGVSIDDNKLKTMDYNATMVYLAEQESKLNEKSLAEYIKMNTGKEASKEQLTVAENLALNEYVSKEEAATLAVKNINIQSLQELMKADKEKTNALLVELGIRKQSEVKTVEDITAIKQNANLKQYQDSTSASEMLSGIHKTTTYKIYESWEAMTKALAEQWLAYVKYVESNIPNPLGTGGIGGNQQPMDNPTGLPGFAKGVNDFRGGMALVGERGPELVNLPKGADVIPNRQSMQMLQGGRGAVSNTINISVNASGTNYSPEDIANIVANKVSRTMIRQGAY